MCQGTPGVLASPFATMPGFGITLTAYGAAAHQAGGTPLSGTNHQLTHPCFATNGRCRTCMHLYCSSLETKEVDHTQMFE